MKGNLLRVMEQAYKVVSRLAVRQTNPEGQCNMHEGYRLLDPKAINNITLLTIWQGASRKGVVIQCRAIQCMRNRQAGGGYKSQVTGTRGKV